MTIYKKLNFPKYTNRPFIFTDFVSTLDGKVFVKKDGYWPFGSKTDFETFTYIRAHADVIIDGAGTALKFGKNSIETFKSRKFQTLRESLGKKDKLEYIILTKNPDPKLQELVKNNPQTSIFKGSISDLLIYLKNKKYKHVFLNGGATLLGSFLKEKLIDEIFLTIAPRIFGNKKDVVLSLVEEQLFLPSEVTCELISHKALNNEIFLRYKVIYK